MGLAPGTTIGHYDVTALLGEAEGTRALVLQLVEVAVTAPRQVTL